MNIPDDMLPEVIPTNTAWGPSAKLPPLPSTFNSPMRGVMAEEKARRYLEEACRSLALFKYWAEKATE